MNKKLILLGEKNDFNFKNYSFIAQMLKKKKDKIKKQR